MVSLKALQLRDCEKFPFKSDFSTPTVLQTNKLMIFLNLGTEKAFSVFSELNK